MNVSDDLFLAHELPTKDGYSWTLASRLGQMLQLAQSQFGSRDLNYTPVGIEFAGDRPQIWFPGNCGHIVIQLSTSAATDSIRACYQLAHETIHLLSPTGKANANVLEEGLAVFFSRQYLRENFNTDWGTSGLPEYGSACAATECLLAIDPDSIRRIREEQPVISLITSEMLSRHYPSLHPDLCNELARRF